MSEAPIKTPTLDELRDAGYIVEIEHNRLNRVAYAKNGKVIVKEVLSSEIPKINEEVIIQMAATLPKGGMTEVYVTDPNTSAEFYGYGRCHPNDNYDKKTGVLMALKKIAGLMVLMDGEEGFKCRLQL